MTGVNGGTDARDFPREINGLLGEVRGQPDDAGKLQQLRRTAEEWLASDGLSPSAEAERTTRVKLAEWVTGFPTTRPILHLGWREAGIGAALAAEGATVVSFLDHPARSIAAAVTHGSERLSFDLLERVGALPAGSADLLLLETAGAVPVVPLEHALQLLSPGGLLAVLGMPQVPDYTLLNDVGAFRLTSTGSVVPCAAGSSSELLSLFRVREDSVKTPPETSHTAPFRVLELSLIEESP